MTRKKPCRPDQKGWTDADDATMRLVYPNHSNDVVAKVLGRTAPAISNRAVKLGLRKSPDYLSNHANRFKPGITPWNTGLKGWDAGGRSAETRFKKGQMHGAAQHNYKPIGSLRINDIGHLERKVTDDPDIYPARRWVGVHRLVWEAVHGPVPTGYVVRFKDGKHTVNDKEITIDRLECITQRENMRRNSTWTKYPHEIARLVQLKGAINRQVNRIAKESEA